MSRLTKNNILIYRLGSLGDTVMALPCFHKIKDSFPDADITLLTNRPVMAKAAPLEAVLGQNYFFNRVINYPVGTRSPRVLLDIILKIRRLKIDTVVNITPTRSRLAFKRDYLFFKAAGVKTLIGFDGANEDFEVAKDPLTGVNEWEAKRLARRIDVLGSIPLEDNHYWDLKLTKDEKLVADNCYKGQQQYTSTLVISLGTKNPANDWELDNWLILLENLSFALPGWQLLVIGAPNEKDAGDRCLLAWGKHSINLCGQTTPRESAAVLAKANVFIGHDSGPMHLAACVGVPCVGIYSARNLPGQWFPRGNFNQILYNLPACAGCGLEVCITQQKKCILSISVEQVQQAVLKVIDNKQKNITHSVNPILS
ncbi:glycosyltransferase family 9 protein [Mucilaginibacter sp. SP1R1]|uniref:glycosyltransferase family 9 protein n=1 Tax=Mucilaginibacter sp. SP1R1 TaxID=2723091 RepID=UPI001620FA17|nr:glycosyltransferase family 9 protein [Mucilaginibacter sp. SP1R1]MBB6149060.1 ADP-heptose:LPS heptosyltransferase [Mucilaginibacter sp. SP1R1]